MKILINCSDSLLCAHFSTSVAKLLKESISNVHITLIIPKESKALFENHPYVDNLWMVSKSSTIFTNILQYLKFLKKEKFNCFIHIKGDLTPVFISFLKRIKVRAGSVTNILTRIFLNKGKNQRRTFVEMHEIAYNIFLTEGLLKEIDLSSYEGKITQKLRPTINLKETEIDNVNDVDFKDEDFILLHPGMAKHSLNWPPTNYPRLIRRLNIEFDEKVTFIITYTKKDQEVLKKIRKKFSEEKYKSVLSKVKFVDGNKVGLDVVLRLIKKAKLYIGPSSTPIHFANALDTPILGIYSPIKNQSTMRWGPFYRDNKNVKIVVPEVVCGEFYECAKTKCPYYSCMSKIEVETVMNESLKLMGQTIKD